MTLRLRGQRKAGDAIRLLKSFRSISFSWTFECLNFPAFKRWKNFRRLHQTSGPCLLSFECDEEIYAAVKAGAQGYLHKDAPAEEIVRAIGSVRGGQQAFPRRIMERLSTDQMTAGLSHRERQVLELVAKGLTNKEVANTLQISQFTVQKSSESCHPEVGRERSYGSDIYRDPERNHSV